MTKINLILQQAHSKVPRLTYSLEKKIERKCKVQRCKMPKRNNDKFSLNLK
jgi:hypothetical protein